MSGGGKEEADAADGTSHSHIRQGDVLSLLVYLLDQVRQYPKAW